MKDASQSRKAAEVFDASARGYWAAGAAWYLGRAQITLRKWRVAGCGPAYRLIRGRAYYTREDLDAFMDGHRRFRSTAEATVAQSAA